MLEDEQKVGVGVFVAPIFNLILALIWPTFPMIFMSNLKEKGSNLPHSVHNVLIWLVGLFFRSFAKETRNTPISIRNEAFGMHFDVDYRSDKPQEPKEAEKKSARRTCRKGRPCTSGRSHRWPARPGARLAVCRGLLLR